MSRARPRDATRGYTIVELMMSLVVLAIGVAGVIAMQKVTVASNRNAKEIAIATRVAEAWADELTADAATWSTDGSGASTRPNTTWLKLADPAQTVDWFIPSYSSARAFGPSFGGLGNPVDPATSASLAHFCTHIRFAFLHSETAPTAGNGVIRAQVRVFWPREGTTVTLPLSITKDVCATTDALLTTNIGAFNVVYLTTAVRQTPTGLLN